MSQYPIVSGLLIGSALSSKDMVDCRDAGTDPALFEQTLGITWDYLELCLSYGLSFEQIKGLTLTAPSFAVERKLRHDAVSGGDSRGKDMMGGPITGDGGVVSEVGHGLVHQNTLENAIDGRVNGLIPRLLLGLRRIVRRAHGQRSDLDASQQTSEPRAFAANGHQLEKDGVGGKIERGNARLKFSLPSVVVSSRRVHWWSPHKHRVTLP